MLTIRVGHLESRLVSRGGVIVEASPSRFRPFGNRRHRIAWNDGAQSPMPRAFPADVGDSVVAWVLTEKDQDWLLQVTNKRTGKTWNAARLTRHFHPPVPLAWVLPIAVGGYGAFWWQGVDWAAVVAFAVSVLVALVLWLLGSSYNVALREYERQIRSHRDAETPFHQGNSTGAPPVKGAVGHPKGDMQTEQPA